MKKKLIVFGLFGATLLLLGAVTVETIGIQSRTVSSWSELVDIYYSAREELPPLPLQTDDVINQIAANDWSFLSDHWQIRQSGGIYYVAKKSELAKKVKLPLTVRIFEDVRLGEVFVMSSPDGTNFQGEVAFTAPEIVTDDASLKTLYALDSDEVLTEKEKESLLFWELSPRRICFEITLKSEDDAWADVFAKTSSLSTLEQESAISLDGGGMMMSMSVPPEHTNDLWLALETDGAVNTLNVFAPEGVTNIEAFACDSLLNGGWTRIATNVNPSGPTNPAVLTVGGFEKKFFRARTWDDADSDGLSGGQELYEYKTNPNLADSDDDDLNDGTEVQTYGTNPASNDTDNDGMPDGWEVAHGLNPLADDAHLDPDGDNFDNLHEYLSGTDPQSDISKVEDLIFDETDEHVACDDGYTSFIMNESLALSGTNCIEFTILNQWHYSAKIEVNDDGHDYDFINADELRFYIRTASGTYTNPLYLRLIYWSGSSDNMDSLDIQPYLYDLNDNPSPNITEQYKMVKIPYANMTSHQGTDQFVGVFQDIQLRISEAQATNSFPFPKIFYVDQISMQDTQGLTVENIEPLNARHLEVTCSDKLDFISARNLTNHVITGTNGQIAVANIGLRSWVEDFKNSSEDSPIVKHYIYLELAEPLVSGQTYIYSNAVQDVSGNWPGNGVMTFSYNETNVSSSIKVNQVGWFPEATKIAYVGNYLGDLGEMHLDTNVSHTAYVQDASTGLNVYTAQVVRAEYSDYVNNNPEERFSGEEVWRIDFSSLKTTGNYRVYVPGVGCSYDFEIGSNIYDDVYYDCMRSLWFQRSGICMTNPAYSGIWARQGDAQLSNNIAFYHNSVWDKSPVLYAGEEIAGHADFTGGWYDAADYNKYTKSGADAVNMLLTMFEIIPERFADNQLNLPESGNEIPDILDEAKWELDWIVKMVSSNGAAFNKVTRESWVEGMPGEQTGKMWVTLKSTRDTAAACAILAKAARIYAPYDSTASALYSNKATLAWQCLTNYPDSYPIPPAGKANDYANPPGTNWVVNGVTNVIPNIGTGPYFSENDFCYRVWAHTEMYLLTGNPVIHEVFSNVIYQAMQDYGIADLETAMGRIMYGNIAGGGDGYSGATRQIVMFYDYASQTNGFPVYENIRSVMADKIVGLIDNNWLEEELPYDFEVKSLSNLRYGEGSQVRRPYGYILAYELTGDTNWLERARINLDWPLGANPLSTTYITGIGTKYPLHPHNKIDHYDDIEEPIPGFNIYGIAASLTYENVYAPIMDHAYPRYRDDIGNPDWPMYPVARKYVDTWKSVLHGEFVIDDLARTAMVFAYFSSTNAP